MARMLTPIIELAQIVTGMTITAQRVTIIHIQAKAVLSIGGVSLFSS